jgi:hypothetical protein
VGGALTSIKTLLERDPCSHAKTAIAMIDAILLQGGAAQTTAQWAGLTPEEVTRVNTVREAEEILRKKNTAAQPAPVAIDQSTMELAESVGLIGPASRTHDLHYAIQRFHDLICVNATIKAAQMAADVIRESAAQPAPVQEPVAWVPYLSDRADGVQGHYAIARWNPRGYREVWNLRRHAWSAFSDDVMSLEEADYLLQQITIPTRKPTPPAQPAESPLQFTSGHCKEKAKVGGCQLHNLHCNFPACDRKAT